MKKGQRQVTIALMRNEVEYDAQSEVLRLTERGMAVGNQIFDVFVIN